MRIPSKVSKRIEYWESKTGLSKMKRLEKPTKTFKLTIEKLLWTTDGHHLYENESVGFTQFRQSVDNYHTELIDWDYFPATKTHLKGIPLHLFVYNQHASTKFQRRLLYHLHNPPIPVDPKKLKNRRLYDSLCKSYLQITGNSTKKFSDLTPTDLDNLANTTYRLADYQKENKGMIVLPYNKTLADLFMRHVSNMVSDNLQKFGTKTLVQPWVWENFPNYMAQNGLISQPKRFSINKPIEEKMNDSTKSRPVLKRRGRRV